MEVPLVDLQAQCAPIAADLRRALLDVVESQAFILGPTVTAFEREVASYLGVEHAIGCASGSDALVLALKALGVEPGDEVVTVPLTYVATPEAIARVGARVVFCDVDPTSWTLDPRKLADRITERTRAILPVHLYGQCADVDAIRAVAGRIPIVEDAAQAFGAEYKGRKAGSLGAIACFSFYPTKPLGGFGDGGLLATDDGELAQRLRSLRVHGETVRYRSGAHGLNSRLAALQAAVLRVKLPHVDRWNAGRREVAEQYRARFAGSRAELARVAPWNVHVWHQCVVRVPERDAVRERLTRSGVGCAVFYEPPQHLQPCFAELGHRPGDFPFAEEVCRRGLSIPCWPELSTEEREFVAERVLELVRG
jgi:dTDP-4-amino-4,6-dideoxygalactose transaminase